MFPQKFIPLFIIGIFYLTGCGHNKEPLHQEGYYHSGIYFGKNFPPNYRQGIADGCTTSKGIYTKSHTLFNNDQNYNHGWFLGRNRCRHLLVIENEKNGET